MARKGLFAKIQPPPGAVQADLVSRLQDNLADVVNQLTADDDLFRSPAVYLSASALIPSGAAVVVYKGGPSRILTLPPASGQGVTAGQLLAVLNVASVAVTLAPAGGDTLNGTTSLLLPAGGMLLLAADGVSRWLAPGSAGTIPESAVINLVTDLAGKQPTGNYLTALTGDVTAAGPGAGAAAIAANAVTNAKAAQMPTLTVKGNNTGGTANAADLTVAQMQAMITYPGRLRSFQVLTAGTTYTRPAGITSILVEGWAGGGGGGGCTFVASSCAVGGGGASGGYFRKWYLVAPATGTYAIGGAGTAGANTGGTGGTGGNTTFTDGTTLCTANGGPGGVGQTAGTALGAVLGGAAPAVSTNGDVNSGAAPGGYAVRLSGTVGVSGAGGSGLGGAGGAPVLAQGAGNAGIGFGAGGSGGCALTAAVTGGAGAPGRIVVWEFA